MDFINNKNYLKAEDSLQELDDMFSNSNSEKKLEIINMKLTGLFKSIVILGLSIDELGKQKLLSVPDVAKDIGNIMNAINKYF